MNILMCFFLFAVSSDKPEVFHPKYSQTAILLAAHFRRVVKRRNLTSPLTPFKLKLDSGMYDSVK